MAKTVTTSFSESNIDITNNKSSLTITCYFSANNQSTYSYNKTLYCTCNGETQTATVSLYAGGYVEESFTFDNIEHNADGSKSVDYNWSCNTQTSGVGVASDSGTYALTQIPRKANLTSAPNFNDEENPVIQYSNLAGNSATTLQACISLTGANADVPYRDISKTGSSYTFNLTTAERNTLRNATTGKSRTVVFIVKTVISGTTYTSTLTRTLSIINANPTFSNFTYQDTNTTVTSKTGNNQILVRGLSTLQATVSSANKMVANKGATPKNYVATIEGNTVSQNYSTSDINFNLGTINASGTKRLTMTAFDSRDNSTVVTKDITVIDYTKPSINASVTRLNNFENTTTIKVSGTYSRVTIGAYDRNTISELKYRKREKGGDWGYYTNFTKTLSAGTYTAEDVVLDLDNTKAFDIEIYVKDNFNQVTTLVYSVDIGQAIFFISTNNKTCYINGKEVSTKEYVDTTKTNLLDQIYPVGSIYLSTSNTNPSTFLGGTWSLIAQGRTLVGVNSSDSDFNAPKKTGGEKTHTLTINEMPAHEHEIFTSYAGTSHSSSKNTWTNDNWTNVYQEAGSSMTSKGGGQSFNNMPPYYTCYIWNRTA